MPKNDRANQESKIILKGLLVKWKGVVDKDRTLLGNKRLYSMIRDVKEYANMDHTASYAKEGQLYRKILTDMEKNSKDLEKKILKTGDIEDSKALAMIQDLNEYFSKGKDGYLKVPSSVENHITSHDKQIEGGEAYGILPKKMVKYKDTPLFSHDPSLEDLKHGQLKNGNINATLGILVQQNPNFIKESMMDNKDGTVTVRLFQAIHPVDQVKKPQSHIVYKPVYVTVDKSLPEGVAEPNSLWVSLYEKALVASGMFYSDKDDPVNRAVPGNIEQLYNKYKKLPKTEWPTRQQCPWLIDENGNLHKWNPSYQHLKERGNVINTLECIIGEQGRSGIRMLDYDAKKSKEDKKEQALKTVYSEIIRNKVGGDNNKYKQIMEYVGQPRKANPETYLKNMHLCAALLSSMSLEDAEKHFKKIRRNKAGKITSFPLSAEQKMLEHLETELDKRIEQIGPNGKLDSYKNLMKLAAINAQYQLQRDPNQEIADLAKGKSAESLQQLINTLLQQEKAVYRDITSYSGQEENIFNEITTHLEKGRFLMAGAKSSFGNREMGNQTEKGLKQESSHGIIGITKEVHGGREYKYVLVFDPENQGEQLSYDYSTNPPKPVINNREVKDGIKKVELHHFCESFQQFTVSGRERLNIELPENMMTREMISDYSNFLNYFNQELEKEISSMKTEEQKFIFKELQTDISDKTKELADCLGKDMRSVSFKNIKENAEKYKIALEKSEKPNIKQIKLLNRIQTLSRLYDGGLKNPKGLLLDSLEKSMEKENMLDTYYENDYVKTAINSHADIQKLNQQLNGLKSESKQFHKMQKALKDLDDLMKGANSGRIPRKEYTKAIEKLFSTSEAYLEYMEKEKGSINGIIKASGGTERKSIEIAEKIRDYASARKNLMRHQNLRDALKHRTANQMVDRRKNSELGEETKEFKNIINSDILNEVLDKASDNTIEKILKSDEAAKTFAQKVNLQMNKTNERQVIDRFRNDALRALDDKQNNFEKREYLARLFFADALKSVNPRLKMGQIRRYEKDMMESIVSSDTITRCIEEEGILNLDKEKALKLLGKYGTRFQKEIKDQLEQVKKGEPMVSVKKQKTDIDKDVKEVKDKAEEQKNKEDVKEIDLNEIEMEREK